MFLHNNAMIEMFPFMKSIVILLRVGGKKVTDDRLLQKLGSHNCTLTPKHQLLLND